MHIFSLEHIASFECIKELLSILSSMIHFITFFGALRDINFNFMSAPRTTGNIANCIRSVFISTYASWYC